MTIYYNIRNIEMENFLCVIQFIDPVKKNKINDKKWQIYYKRFIWKTVTKHYKHLLLQKNTNSTEKNWSRTNENVHKCNT